MEDNLKKIKKLEDDLKQKWKPTSKKLIGRRPQLEEKLNTPLPPNIGSI